ncbi:MAG: hypothetical protein ABI151_05765 [Chitinophagaceae bacterium]
MARNFVLLLTGTIDPDNMAFTKLLDKDSRRAQYLDAIRFWLEKIDFPIVFVENSGNDLSAEFSKEIAERRIGVYTFNGNEYNREIGKGYGEMLCIEHAFQHSPEIKNAGFIFKATGRHKVLNFETYRKQVAEDEEINLLINFYGFLKNCDSRFFGFSPDFVPRFLSKHKGNLNDSDWVFFENVLSSAALEAIAQEYNFRPLREYLRIDGSSGTLGIKYNSGYLSWFKNNLGYKKKNKSFE